MDKPTRIAVITGASRGTGRATAELFARQGMAVVLCARTLADLCSVAERIRAAGGRALTVAADISHETDVDRLFDTTLAAFGRVDVLVNCAGIVAVQPFATMDIATWDRVLAVNLRGTFLCCRRAFAAMVDQNGGIIINVASLSGFPGVEKFPGLSAYNVSKYGVAGLSEILAIEGRPYNIRVYVVSPGAVDTAMLREAAPHLRPGMTPEQLARIFLFLTTPDAAPLSGTNIPIFSNA
jgi:NAD(P)-dependent dehydrogenase (short-subunit alcohol dehydrogenase family)